MLYYALVFLLVALLSAGLGFSGIAGSTGQIAKVLVILFLVLAVVSAIAGLLSRRKPPLPPAV
jgi:uncharacterized membrane protein YtjA (UPF0391 family)